MSSRPSGSVTTKLFSVLLNLVMKFLLRGIKTSFPLALIMAICCCGYSAISITLPISPEMLSVTEHPINSNLYGISF